MSKWRTTENLMAIMVAMRDGKLSRSEREKGLSMIAARLGEDDREMARLRKLAEETQADLKRSIAADVMVEEASRQDANCYEDDELEAKAREAFGCEAECLHNRRTTSTMSVPVEVELTGDQIAAFVRSIGGATFSVSAQHYGAEGWCKGAALWIDVHWSWR